MRPLMVGLCALGICSASAEQAAAAWNNVFQPAFFHHKKSTSSYYVAPAVVYSSPGGRDAGRCGGARVQHLQ